MLNKKDLRSGVKMMRLVSLLLSEWADDMESSLDKKEGQDPEKRVPEEQVSEERETEKQETAKNVVSGVASDAVDEESALVAVPPPTFMEVQGLLAGKSASGYRTQVQALLRSYGVKKLSEVEPSRYAELAAAVKRIGVDRGAG